MLQSVNEIIAECKRDFARSEIASIAVLAKRNNCTPTAIIRILEGSDEFCLMEETYSKFKITPKKDEGHYEDFANEDLEEGLYFYGDAFVVYDTVTESLNMYKDSELIAKKPFDTVDKAREFVVAHTNKKGYFFFT